MARVRSVDLGNPFLESLDGVCELLLVRHGEQGFVVNMPLVEGVDAALNELGRQQAAAVGERLADREIHAVYSSTMQRARDTALAVAAHHGLGVTELETLVEIEIWRDLPQHQGLLDSLDEDELRTILRTASRSLRWDSYPYGEPRDEFRARVVDTIEGLAARHVGERIVVACHGGVINGYLAHVVESALDTPFEIHHTSITTVRASGDLRRIVQINDYGHVLAFQSELNPLNRA